MEGERRRILDKHRRAGCVWWLVVGGVSDARSDECERKEQLGSEEHGTEHVSLDAHFFRVRSYKSGKSPPENKVSIRWSIKQPIVPTVAA